MDPRIQLWDLWMALTSGGPVRAPTSQYSMYTVHYNVVHTGYVGVVPSVLRIPEYPVLTSGGPTSSGEYIEMVTWI